MTILEAVVDGLKQERRAILAGGYPSAEVSKMLASLESASESIADSLAKAGIDRAAFLESLT